MFSASHSEISGVIFRSLVSSNSKIYDSGLDDNHTDLRPVLCALIEPSERISWSKLDNGEGGGHAIKWYSVSKPLRACLQNSPL